MDMIHISKDERVTLTMTMAMDYVTSFHSIRTLAAKYGVPKSTVHKWMTVYLPSIDAKLSAILERKLYYYGKQRWYDFMLTSKDNEILKAAKRAKYNKIIALYSKNFRDPKKR